MFKVIEYKRDKIEFIYKGHLNFDVERYILSKHNKHGRADYIRDDERYTYENGKITKLQDHKNSSQT